MAKYVNETTNVFNFDFESENKQLMRDLAEMRKQAKELEDQVDETRRAYSELNDELSSYKDENGIDVLESKLHRFERSAKKSAEYFDSWLQSFDLKKAFGTGRTDIEQEFDKEMLAIRKRIESGAMSINDAITHVKVNYAHLFEENYKSSGGAMDPTTYKAITDSLTELGSKMDTVLGKIAEFGKGGAASGVKETAETIQQVGESTAKLTASIDGSGEFAQRLIELLTGIQEAASNTSVTIVGLSTVLQQINEKALGTNLELTMANDSSRAIAIVKQQVVDYADAVVKAREEVARLSKTAEFQQFSKGNAGFMQNFGALTRGLMEFDAAKITKNVQSNFVQSAGAINKYVDQVKDQAESLISFFEYINSKGIQTNFDISKLQAPVITEESITRMMSEQSSAQQALNQIIGGLQQERQEFDQTDKEAYDHAAAIRDAARAEEEKSRASADLKQALMDELDAIKQAAEAAKTDTGDDWHTRMLAASEGIHTVIQDLNQFVHAAQAAGNAGGQLGVKLNTLKEQAKLGKFSSWVTEFQEKIKALNYQTPELEARIKSLTALAKKIESPSLSDSKRVKAYQEFNLLFDDMRVKIAAEAAEEKNAATAAKELLKSMDGAKTVQDKLANGSFVSYLRTVMADMKSLSVQSDKLKENADRLKAAFRDMAKAGTMDEAIEAFERWKTAQEGYKSALAADKRSSRDADAATRAAEIKAQTNATLQQKAAQEQLNKTYTDAIKTLKELGKQRMERQKWSGDKESEEYKRADDEVKRLTKSYREYRSELGSNITVEQQKALTEELKRQEKAILDKRSAMDGSAQRQEELNRKQQESIQISNAQKAAQEQQAAAAKNTNDSYKQLLETLRLIGQYRLDKQKAAFAGDEPTVKNAERNLQELIAKYRELRQETNGKLNTDQMRAVTVEIQRQKRELGDLISSQQSTSIRTDNKAFDSATAAFDKAYAAAEQLKYKTEEVDLALANLIDKFVALKNTDPGTEARANAMAEFEAATKHLNIEIEHSEEVRRRDAAAAKAQADAKKAAADAEREEIAAQRQKNTMLRQLNTMLAQCEAAQRKYAAAAKLGIAKDDYSKLHGYVTQIRQMENALRSGGSTAKDLSGDFDRLRLSISDTTTALKTNTNLLGRWATTGMQQLKSRLTYSFGLAAMVYKAANEIKKMISTAVELDSAMNQLQIVTRSSGAEMDTYAKRVSSMAKETAQATKDLIDATTVYARLGYSMDESASLAKYTAMLQGVGNIEASAAQDAMTAILKAFNKNVEDAEDIMNKMVVVGNNFPISVSQIAEGMNNAGSMLAVAGNTLEESIALLTASNATVQNISKASTGLRTIAARIRKTTTEEDDGEAINEAKYEEMLGILTKHHVTLTDINGEYRSTYDVLKDIAAVWDDLTSMEQAAVTEQLAGTRQQNIFSSVITQFKDAEGAMERMGDSAGELEEAYGIYLDSIQAHVQKLKAAYDELARDVVNSDFAKIVIDTLTKVIEAIDWLIEHLGILGTVTSIAGITALIKNFGSLVTLLKSADMAMYAVTSAETALAAGAKGAAGAFGILNPTVLAVVAAIGVLIIAGKKLYDLWREAHPTFEEIRDDAKKAEEEFQNLRKQIEKNTERIEDLNEIKNEGDWTEELQAELTALQSETSELEAQLDLLREIAKYKGEQLETATALQIRKWMSHDQTRVGQNGLTNGSQYGGWTSVTRETEGYGGMLNDIEDYLAVKQDLDDVEQDIRDHNYEEGESAEKLYADKLRLLDDITSKENKLLDTRKQLIEFRGYLAGSRDELAIEMIEQLNGAIEELDEAMGKTPKTFKDFKNDLNGLSDRILKKFLSGLEMTEDELRDFKKWLDLSGYSAEKAIAFFNEYIQELNAPQDTGEQDITAKRIGELTSLRDELALTTTAIEEYNRAMEGGEKGDIVKDIAEIYKGAMEDIKSGRIDSNRVNALAELLFSPEQLAAWGFDIARVGKEMQSEMLQAMFDPAGDSTKSYGQRFAEYIRETFGEGTGVGVRELDNGRFEFYYDSIGHLADVVGMSEEVVAAFLDDLDAYGVEVMRSAADNAELIQSIQQIKKELGSGASMTQVAEEFARKLAEGGRNAFQIGRILEDMRDAGELNITDADIVNAVKAAKALIDTQEDSQLLNIDEAKLSLQDLRTFFENLFKEPVKAVVEPEIHGGEGFGPGEGSSVLDGVSDEFAEAAESEGLQAYEDKLKDLYGLLGDLSEETGSVRTATKILVDLLRSSGMTDEGIQGVLDGLRGMGDAYIPTLQELDAEATDLNNTLDDLGNKDINPTVNLDTSAAYQAIHNIVSSLDTLSRRSYMINLGVNSFGTESSRSGAYKNYSGKTNQGSSSRASGGVTGKAGPTLVNELGPELISDRGRAFIANNGEPGFVNLSKDAIVFTAEETKKISGSGRKGLIGRLLGNGTGAAATGKWTCNICGYASNSQTDIKCRNCGSVRGATKTSTTSSKQKANQQAKIAYTSTTSGKLGTTTAGKTATTTASSWWYCSNCGHANPSSSSRCEYCGASKNGSLISKGLSTGATKTIKTALGNKTVFQAGQGYGLEDLFTFGDDGSAGGGGGGGGSSQSESNPSKRDWIEVKLNRIQREISDLEKVAESGLKKLSVRLDAAKQEASKLNEEIVIAQQGYERYLQEAESVGLSSDLAAKVRNGAIDINEYDEETQQLISEYEEWYNKALECASAVEELNQQIGELYKTNFDLVQADYANQLGLIEHEMSMINADMSMAQAKGMLDSAAYYERLAAQETVSIGKMKSELSDLEKYFNEAMNSGKIAENSEEWYAMRNEINGVKEAIAGANVQLQEYQKTIREIKWSYFDYAQDRFNDLTQEAGFLISLLENSKLFDDRGKFSNAGFATLGMRAVNFDAYMSQADAYAKEILEVEREIATDPYNRELIDRRMSLLQLQRQSILAAEQEKTAVRSLVQEGIQIELDSLKDLIDAYKDSLDSAKDLYEYQKKISEKTSGIASIQKQLAAYQGDDSEETRAKVQKLNKDLEKAQVDLAETEREQSISDQKKLLDDVYSEYEELVNKRLDNLDLLMKEMIDAANANSEKISNELFVSANEVGYIITEEMQTAMNGHYANYDRIFDGISGATTVLNNIYSNVNAMARAAGAVKAYAKGGLVDYTGLAAVHGTPGNPELVLSAADTEKFLQAAQMMQIMNGIAPSMTRDISSLIGNGGGGGMNIGGITLDISIDHVQDYNDFVTQLQSDPKFEKLIDTMTMGRMLGGSKLAKNGIRF